MSCNNCFKLTTVKVVLVAVFVVVNVLLYTQSKYVIMETVFHQFNTNRSSTNFHFFSHTKSEPQSASPNDSRSVARNDYYYNTVAYSEIPFLKDPIVNPHNYKYLITPNATCVSRQIDLIICAVISGNNDKGRTVIRNTWGSYAQEEKNNAILVFFLGADGNFSDRIQKSQRQSKIQQEALMYGDLLQEDYIDSYANLSLKSVSVLRWVKTFCSNARFVLKVDDDMYVNIPFMVNILRDKISDKSTARAFVMGSLQIGASPIRSPNSKWFTPYSLFSEEKYPNYVSGTAYVMTSTAAVLLYEASLRVPLFWLEDIYITGLCSRKAGVTVYDSKYFSYSKPKASGCSFKAQVSGHRYSLDEIQKIHKELYDPNLYC